MNQIDLQMPSIIEGYNYDIFISYRQKDNKYDGWVTEFVDNLKKELEATFKEDISVYFDINPHDGLLETHHVSESLKDKLKCLIFIPIISRTYCDPKSFAWEHEFKAFVKQASKDQFGLKVRLLNGNVASRVLPVRIHDLDNADIKECESVLGGVLRGIEFIYKEPGVNKPLTADDDEKENLNGTKYRIQLNKTANAIKEIISGLKKEPLESVSQRKEGLLIEEKPLRNEKSIIVLPFENISPDPDQEYFSDGLTEEIITDLSYIHDLLVISRSSAMTFKKSNKKIKDIAHEVNVKYVLEGSVRKAGNNLKIIAQLIDAENDKHLWAEKYNGTLDDVFDIQEKVSRSIADALKIRLSSAENIKISEQPIDNTQAYDCYLRAKREMFAVTADGLKRALVDLKAALDIMGENVLLYQGIAETHLQYYEYGIKSDEETLQIAEAYTKKVITLKPDSAEGHYLLGRIERFRGTVIKSILHFKNALAIDPNHCSALLFLASAYGIQVGKAPLSEPLLRKLHEIDPLTPLSLFCEGYIQWLDGKLDNAMHSFQYFLKMEPESIIGRFIMVFFLAWQKDYDQAFYLVDKMKQQGATDIYTLLALSLKCALRGEKKKAVDTLSEEAKKVVWNDPELSWFGASIYALIEEKEEALLWLEHSIDRGWINYPLFAGQNPFLFNISSEVRFKKLMERVKYEWENFEV